MAEKIYGVDPEGEVNPRKVRDAIVKCFFLAHCADSDVAEAGQDAARDYCRGIVKKAFADSGGDFDAPTKDSIRGAIAKLAEFSRSFRDPELIKRHYDEIMTLVNRLE